MLHLHYEIKHLHKYTITQNKNKVYIPVNNITFKGAPSYPWTTAGSLRWEIILLASLLETVFSGCFIFQQIPKPIF